MQGGVGCVLSVTLGYTINTNYANRHDKEADGIKNVHQDIVCLQHYHGSDTSFTGINQDC